MTELLVLYLAGGLLLCLLSLPLIARKVGPNPFYGFRVPRTFEDREVWFEANHYAGKRLLAAGASTLLAAVVLYFIPGISVDAYALGCLAVFALVLVVGLVQSFRYLQAISKSK